MANSGAINDGITDVAAADSTIIVSGAPNVTLKANVGTTVGTVAAGDDSRFGTIPAAATAAAADLAAAAAVGTSAKFAREDHVHKLPTMPTWSTLSGKPATFPPTIGTTSATAMAGNTAIPAAATAAPADLAAAAAVGTSAKYAREDHKHQLPTAADIGAPDYVGPTIIAHIWGGTQAQYDAIGTKDANTMYVVK